MKAVIYAAKSTADVHDSIPDQIRDARQLALDEQAEVVAVFQEEDESAYHGNRGPELEAAMQRCEQEAPCLLIVQHTSRLARGDGRGEAGARHLLEIVLWARRKGVLIKSVENPIPNDENDLVIAAVHGAQDHAYSKRLGTSVSGGLARSFARGNWPGKPSDGYVIKVKRDAGGRVERRWLEKDPELEPTIRRMLELGLQQMLPPASIARTLNADGRRNKNGNEWRSRDVKRALCNPMYAGILRYKGDERREACDPYISEQEHERLLAHYDHVKPRCEGPTRPGRRTDGYVLRGLAVCGRCGRTMTCHTRLDYGPEPKRFYRCSSFAVHADCGARIAAEPVDAEVVRWLDYLIGDFEEWRQTVLDAASSEREQAQRELDAALALVDKLDKRGGKIEADYLKALDRDDERAGDAFARLMERVRLERENADAVAGERRAALMALDADAVGDRLGETVRRLSQRDVEAVNDALRVEFDRFVIDPDSGDVTPEWKPPEVEFDVRALFEQYRRENSKFTEPC